MTVKRREFVIGAAASAGCIATGTGAAAAPCPPSNLRANGTASSSPGPTCPSGGGIGSLLNPLSDVTYLGYHDVLTDGNDSTYYQGMQVRRTSSGIKLLLAHLNGRVVQVPLTGVAFGAQVPAVEMSWDISLYLNWYHKTIWWDEDGQRLWTLNSDGYSNESNPCRIYSMTLDASGTVSSIRGPVGLAGLGSKRTRSGFLKVPAAFRSAHGVGPYAVGLGAYTSLMAAGGSCAMGLSLYAIPDPGGLASNALIPTSGYRALAARGSTPRGERLWYGYDFNTETGKGPINYYDGTNPNPNNRPSQRPSADAAWLSPNSNGRAYWMWGDRYVGGTWLDGFQKSGILVVGDFGTGKGWYQNSTLNFDGRCSELHVFDPQHLSDVLAGRRTADSLQPVAMRPLPEMDSGSDVGYGRGCFASFDLVGRRMYILKAAMNGGYMARLYVYSLSV